MMNKKADIMMKEALTLIVSVLCLLILFYLAYQLYGMMIKKSALEQAKASLDQIINTIERLEDGVIKNFLVTSPKNWFIIVYSKEDSLGSCSGNNCICFCPSTNKEQCDKDGICNSIGLNTVSKIPLKLTNFYELQFLKTGDNLNIYIKDYEKTESR